jgi:hypothetical protein
LSLSDLWLRYLASGGHGDMFDIDAHLNGIVSLSSYEHDVLAYALNERLDELYRAAHVPYRTTTVQEEPVKDLDTVIGELLGSWPLTSPTPGTVNPQISAGPTATTVDQHHPSAQPPAA